MGKKFPHVFGVTATSVNEERQRGRDPMIKVEDKLDNYVYIGYVVSPHGIHGELKVKILTDNLERFKENEYVYLIRKDEIFKSEIVGVKWQNNFVLLKLSDIEDRNQAASFRDFFVGINKVQLKKLPRDTFYRFEIVGLDVYTSGGDFIGRVVDVFSTGSNDVYVVQNGQKEILLPATKEVVKNIDLLNKRMVIEPLPGLL